MKKRSDLLRVSCAWFLGSLLLAGCAAVMHPKAAEYLEQARGADGIETLLNLASMMENTLQETHGAAYETSLRALHDQFHALHMAFRQVSAAHAGLPDYVKAVTLEREMRTVFHRLWEHQRDDRLREMHLALFEARLQELRETLRAVRAAAGPVSPVFAGCHGCSAVVADATPAE